MATAADKTDERRKRVFVGTLPADFLRVHDYEDDTNPHNQQLAADEQAAIALQQQQQLVGVPHSTNAVGRLTLSVIQARLVKNYGLTRMDPYVRIRVGHAIYETHTCNNGSKNPKWNRDIQCLLPQGVTSIYIEILDECSFSMDELIAWTQIPIPGSVLKGETVEEWFLLSGKQGDGLEGSINLVLSYSPVNVSGAYGYPGYYPAATPMAPVITIPAGYGINPYGRPVSYATVPPVVPVSAPPPPTPNPDDVKQMEEMFPNIDKEVIRSVYESNRYRKDQTVNCLIQMAD